MFLILDFAHGLSVQYVRTDNPMWSDFHYSLIHLCQMMLTNIDPECNPEGFTLFTDPELENVMCKHIY